METLIKLSCAISVTIHFRELRGAMEGLGPLHPQQAPLFSYSQ